MPHTTPTNTTPGNSAPTSKPDGENTEHPNKPSDLPSGPNEPLSKTDRPPVSPTEPSNSPSEPTGSSGPDVPGKPTGQSSKLPEPSGPVKPIGHPSGYPTNYPPWPGASSTIHTITKPSTTPYPTQVPGAEQCEYYGCLGSIDDFSGFTLDSESAEMTVNMCTYECKAAGYTFAGLYISYVNPSVSYIIIVNPLKGVLLC